jgi:hypothetical protein
LGKKKLFQEKDKFFLGKIQDSSRKKQDFQGKTRFSRKNKIFKEKQDFQEKKKSRKK